MTRVEHIGNATLYLGDCREILPTLPKVDAVITDPPYEAEAHGAGRRLLGRTDELADKRIREIEEAPLDFEAMTPELRAAMCEWAAANCQGWMLAFCQAEAVAVWREAMEQAGQKWRRAMVWVKPDSSPQLSGDRPAQGFESIAAAWCGEGGSKWNGGGKRGVFIYNKHDPGNGHGGARNEHPTQKPVALMKDLVSLFSNRDDLVLDMCAGSGATGIACHDLGRRFIGIEKKPHHFATLCRRIEDAQRQGRLIA